MGSSAHSWISLTQATHLAPVLTCKYSYLKTHTVQAGSCRAAGCSQEIQEPDVWIRPHRHLSPLRLFKNFFTTPLAEFPIGKMTKVKNGQERTET